MIENIGFIYDFKCLLLWAAWKQEIIFLKYWKYNEAKSTKYELFRVKHLLLIINFRMKYFLRNNVLIKVLIKYTIINIFITFS